MNLSRKCLSFIPHGYLGKNLVFRKIQKRIQTTDFRFYSTITRARALSIWDCWKRDWLILVKNEVSYENAGKIAKIVIIFS